MIKVSQYEYIRTAHRVYGKSIHQISRESGHSRSTIRKVLRGEYQRYKKRSRQAYPVLGSHLKTIDRWIEEDKKSPKKQRHTARRIYNRLKVEYDYQGSESTVRRYVRDARIRLGINETEVYIPSDPLIGQEAEIDWGSAVAMIGGKRKVIKYFCMRSKYSGKHFVKCYPCERQEALFDGHIDSFIYFEGIFPVLIYDNMTTVVQKVFRGKKRILQESYKKFRSYYNFTPRFCNNGKGNEKGGVEGLVRFARRNYMVPIPKAESLSVLNEQILTECFAYGDHRVSGREKTVNERFEEEKRYLLNLPVHPFSNIHEITTKADKYATVIVDKNRYSVGTRNAGLSVKVILSIDKVDVYSSGRLLATHDRLFSNNKWSLHPEHYLDLIQQRIQSFESARPIQQWRKNWPECLEQLLKRFRQNQGSTNGTKDFISVLMFYKEHPDQEIEAAVELALESGISTSQGVKHILLHTGPDNIPEPLPDWENTAKTDPSAYDRLGGGV